MTSKARHRIGLVGLWAAAGFIIFTGSNDVSLARPDLVQVVILLGIICGAMTARYIRRGLI